ncbi:MAG: glycosyltransferase [Paracoccaceae bacterium]
MRENSDAIAPYRKAAEPSGQGIALALGDFSATTGLSRAAAYELKRLRAAHPALEVIDLQDLTRRKASLVHQSGPDVGRLYLLSAPNTYATLLSALPPERVAGARRTGLWVWETPIFPEDWRFALDVVHEIWTPSEYSRAAIASHADGVPVIVRPHYVTLTPHRAPFDRGRFGIPDGAFLGLAIMDLCSCPARKNPWAHVAAWQAAFGADPQHRLLIKVRVSKRTRLVLDELRAMIGAARNIQVFEQEMSAAEIAGLQAEADVFLSLHRAEGYGLNIRECLEAGTEVIATHYSANAEYGPEYPNYHPLPFRLTPYRDWTGHYPDNRFTWAEVSIPAAAATLRACARQLRAGLPDPRPATRHATAPIGPRMAGRHA